MVLETRSGPFVGDDVCLARGRSPPACWREAGATSRAPLLREGDGSPRDAPSSGDARGVRWSTERWAVGGTSSSSSPSGGGANRRRACFRALFAGAFGHQRVGPPVTLEHRCRPFGAERWVATDSSESGRDEAGDRAPSGETDRLRGAPSGLPRRPDRILRDPSQARPRSTFGTTDAKRPILVCPSGRLGGPEA